MYEPSCPLIVLLTITLVENLYVPPLIMITSPALADCNALIISSEDDTYFAFLKSASFLRPVSYTHLRAHET